MTSSYCQSGGSYYEWHRLEGKHVTAGSQFSFCYSQNACNVHNDTWINDSFALAEPVPLKSQVQTDNKRNNRVGLIKNSSVSLTVLIWHRESNCHLRNSSFHSHVQSFCACSTLPLQATQEEKLQISIDITTPSGSVTKCFHYKATARTATRSIQRN